MLSLLVTLRAASTALVARPPAVAARPAFNAASIARPLSVCATRSFRTQQLLSSPQPAAIASAGLLPRAAVRMQGGFADRTVVGTCTEKITAALDPTEIKIEGAYDDPNGSHITIYCVAEAFEGKRSLARQQMVFKAIWEEMQGPVHAVDTMVLKAPSEV